MEIIYQDNDLLVIDKPAGLVVFPEGETKDNTLIDILLKEFPYLEEVGQSPRYGIIHRLDKDTSGILLIAKNNKALEFFQEQFQKGEVSKKYLALVTGKPKSQEGEIETLLGRSEADRRKQKAYLALSPESKKQGLRKAKTRYRIVKEFERYALLEIEPLTGRKHQIRAHLAYLGIPIVKDVLYGFKGQEQPKDLKRQFLHSSYLRIKMPDGEMKEFNSDLPKELKEILNNLK
jgi:23S rRNA pseudouridine1911/1915/1917 synthase